MHIVARSYKKELFSKAANILTKYSLKLNRDVRILEKFVNDVEEVIKQEEVGEILLGDVPDEFLGKRNLINIISYVAYFI